MPIYEYLCPKCKHTTRKIQKFDADNELQCEKCGHEAKRKVSLSWFHLKGSGWPGKTLKSDKIKQEHKRDKLRSYGHDV